MVGLLSYAAAGAVSGLGKGLVEQAEAERERALEELRRQDRAREREQDREWQVADRAQGRAWNIQDRDEGRAWDQSRIDARASDYQAAFGGSGGGSPDNALYAANFFIERGVPPHIAAGLVGNIMQESGPNINPTAVGDNGNAFGAFQHNGPRRIQLMQWAEANGMDPSVFDTQLEFAWYEMQTSERAAFNAIMQAQTAEEAARIASERYWRPGTPHMERRIGFSREVARLLADPETPAAVRDALMDEATGGAEQRAAAVRAEAERAEAIRQEERQWQVEDRDAGLARKDDEAQTQAAQEAEKRRLRLVDEELERLRTIPTNRDRPTAELMSEANRIADERLGVSEMPRDQADLVIGGVYKHPTTGQRLLWNGSNFNVMGQ